MILGRFWIFIGLAFLCLGHSFSLDRNLDPGWNLVSIPVESQTNISSYLANNLSGTLEKIWSYDGGWKKFEPGSDSSNLEDFEKNRGYWFLMGSAGGVITINTEGLASSLKIDRPGWALVSFNQTSTLNIKDEVLGSERIDSDHEIENIAKVWGYSSRAWESFRPASQEGGLGIIEPGLAYWFLIQDSAAKLVNSSSPLIITPAGAVGEASLVIGGATTLLPPTTLKYPQADLVDLPRVFLQDPRLPARLQVRPPVIAFWIRGKLLVGLRHFHWMENF